MDIDDLLRSDGRRWREDLAEESRNTALSPENRLAVLPGATGSTMRRLRVQRRRLRPLIAIAAAVTLICAGGTALFVTEYASTASSSAGTTDDLQPSAADLQQYEAVTLVSPTILPPDHLPRGAIHMPWKLMSLNADETQLTIVYVTGDSGCVGPVGVSLRESTNAVIIDPISHKRPGAGSECPADLGMQRSVISLSAPLGSRALIHPAVDHSWQDTLK